MIEEIFEPLLLATILATGGGIIAYFRRRDRCLKNTQDMVNKLDEKFNILMKVLGIILKKNHPEFADEFNELLKLVHDEDDK